MGIWLTGRKSFGCVTTKRVASLVIAPFGEKVYQDGELDMLNSSAIHHPSKLILYVGTFLIATLFIIGTVFLVNAPAWIALLLFLANALVSLALWYLLSRMYYRFVKCGLILWVREGLPLYLFVNRGKILKANHFYSLVCQYRTWNKELNRNIVLTRSE